MSFIVSQKIKGRIYLYKVESYWDKERKKARQRRTYIGPQDRVRGGDVKPVLSELSIKHYGNTAVQGSRKSLPKRQSLRFRDCLLPDKSLA